MTCLRKNELDSSSRERDLTCTLETRTKDVSDRITAFMQKPVEELLPLGQDGLPFSISSITKVRKSKRRVYG